MKAVVVEEFGGPKVLTLADLPTPRPLPTEIQVRVAAAGINPVDWKTRGGGGMAGVLGAPPFVLGWDVAGVVAEVGFGVTRFRVGDRVFGMPWFPRAASAYAEYVTAPARHFAPLPSELSFEQAAGLPLAGLTAWQALVDTAHIQPGQRVLIHAAAGGVGHLAVQIAKARGAYVVGTARAAKHDVLRRLGADELVDYTSKPFEDEVRSMDVVLDLVGDEYGIRSLKTLRPDGLLIAVPGGVSEELATEAERRGIRVTGILVEPDHAGLEELAALVRKGQLTVLVDRVYSFAEAAKGHADGEASQNLGKSVLVP